MACYKPLIAEYPKKVIATKYDKNGIGVEFKEIPAFLTSKGNPGVRIIGQFDDKYADSYRMLEDRETFTIPCGKCIGCRLDYARHWADRMILEYEDCKKAVFVTLTYDDKYLPDVNPENGEKFNIKTDLNDAGAPISPLIKSDMSEFMKRLRSKFKDNHHNIKVRFFGCGEYGEKRHRPHMHIILFRVGFEDLQILFNGDIRGDLEPWVRNELNQVSYRSNLLESVWQERGIVTVSDVSYETMGYVARYSLKKAKGDDYAEKYSLPKEFTLMSRNPGIGATFLESHPGILDRVSTWYVKGKEIYWPSYLIEKYFSSPGDIEIPGEFHYYKGDPLPQLLSIKEQKANIALNKFLYTFEYGTKPYYEKQEFLEKQSTERVKKLKRGDVTLE